MLISMNYLVVALVLNGVTGVFSSLGDGEPCQTKLGISGTCRFLSKCKSALDGILKGKVPQDNCGFLGTQCIVCCTDPAPIPVTSVPVSTRISETNKITEITTMRTTTTEMPKRSEGEVGEKSAKMCKEYAQHAYDTSDVILSFFDKEYRTLNCAFDKETLIVGGTRASRKEFPHMAQIGYMTGGETEWGCGGSLISEKFVLTGAHCIWSMQLGAAKQVRVGITNTSDINHLQIRNVHQIIKHPGYIGQRYNDIALLKMDRNFEMNPYVRPACLYTQKTIPYTKAIASGWGKIGFSSEASEDLLKVTLEFFSTAQCNKTYRRDIMQPDSSLAHGIDDNSMICAGSTEDIKDSCQGDSGGPLQVYFEDTDEIKCMYNIVGITSFGKSCGLFKNVPGVYTRVSAYVKWIEDNVWIS